MTPIVRPASAIAFWSLGATGVAAIALAGDRTFFRQEPATPPHVALVGLASLLVLGWPIWSSEPLVRTFVAGQGVILLLIASATTNDAVAPVGGWLLACGVAFLAAGGVQRFRWNVAATWTGLLLAMAGATTLGLLRKLFEAG